MEYGNVPFKEKIRQYISSFWNVLDGLCIGLFSIGLPISLLHSNQLVSEYGRAIVIFSLLLYYVQILHMFAVHKVFGPKLIMIGRMLMDVVVIFTIIFVFIIAFAVVSQSLMYKSTRLDKYDSWNHMFRRSYWSMFGDMGRTLQEFGNVFNSYQKYDIKPNT